MNESTFYRPGSKSLNVGSLVDHNRTILMPCQRPVRGRRFVKEYRSYGLACRTKYGSGDSAHPSRCTQQRPKRRIAVEPDSGLVHRNSRQRPVDVMQSGSIQRRAKMLRAVTRERHAAHVHVFNVLGHVQPKCSNYHAAFAAPFSAMRTRVRRMPVAPLRRSGGVSHSSKNTTFMSGRTRAPASCLLM
jgi:hypothetical protein